MAKMKPGTHNPLTARQREVYDFIVETIRREQCPPTRREIQQRFGYATPGSVLWLLQALQAKGLILVVPNQSRGIRLIPQDRDALSARMEELDRREAVRLLASGDGPKDVMLRDLIAMVREIGYEAELGADGRPHLVPVKKP